jgi:ankyrin repeat protein
MVKYLFHHFYWYALFISISILHGMEKRESNDSMDHSNRANSDDIPPYVVIAQCTLSEAILKQDSARIEEIYNNVSPDLHCYITHAQLNANTIEQYKNECPVTKTFHDTFVQMNAPYMQNASPYGWAIFIGNQSIINKLPLRETKPEASRCADINLPCTAHKYTPLHIAAQFQPHLIPYLLQHGAQQSLNAFDNEGNCPTMIPCTEERASKELCTSFQFLKTEQQRNSAAFHAFTAMEISFNNVKQKNGKTALHVAAQYGKKEIVDLLLKKRVDINQTDDEQQTPIFFAVLNKHFTIAKTLLYDDAIVHNCSLIKGADDKHINRVSILDYIDASDSNGDELTRLLVRSGAPAPFLNPPKFLLEKSFEPYLRRLSPLYKKYLIAIFQKNYDDAKKEIGKAKKENLLEMDLFSCNPLHWAVIQGNKSVVEKVLKKAHCLPSKKLISFAPSKPLTRIYQQCDDTLRTPLMWAQKLQKQDIVELFKQANIIK